MMFGSLKDNKDDDSLVYMRLAALPATDRRIGRRYKPHDPFMGALGPLNRSTSCSDLLSRKAQEAATGETADSHCTVLLETTLYSAGPPPGLLVWVRVRIDKGHKGRQGLGSHFEPSSSRLNWLLRT